MKKGTGRRQFEKSRDKTHTERQELVSCFGLDEERAPTTDHRAVPRIRQVPTFYSGSVQKEQPSTVSTCTHDTARKERPNCTHFRLYDRALQLLQGGKARMTRVRSIITSPKFWEKSSSLALSILPTYPRTVAIFHRYHISTNFYNFFISFTPSNQGVTLTPSHTTEREPNRKRKQNSPLIHPASGERQSPSPKSSSCPNLPDETSARHGRAGSTALGRLPFGAGCDRQWL